MHLMSISSNFLSSLAKLVMVVETSALMRLAVLPGSHIFGWNISAIVAKVAQALC